MEICVIVLSVVNYVLIRKVCDFGVWILRSLREVFVGVVGFFFYFRILYELDGDECRY